MRKIKVFVASSKELEEERMMMAVLANSLNTALESQDIEVIAILWENLDSSVGVEFKQEEYNKKLRECEMCVVFYATHFGMYTKQEFDIAYNELITGNNPQKLYVYFKEGNCEPVRELREFRDSFTTEYGHFFSQYQNLDVLKAHFLLQFINYQRETILDFDAVELHEGKVMVGGMEHVNLQNLPYAGNNKRYNELREHIQEIEADLLDMNPESDRYKQKEKKLATLKEELDSLETVIWDTALQIAKMSSQQCNDRLQRAIECFNQGDNQGAAALLNEEEIYKDAERCIELIRIGEVGRKNLLLTIDALLAKIKLLHPSWRSNNEINATYEQISAILAKIIHYASIIYGENSKEVLRYCKLARNLFEYQPKRRLSFLAKAIEVVQCICCEDEVDEMVSIYRDIAWAYEENSCNDFDAIIQCKESVVKLICVKYGEYSHEYIHAIKFYSEALYWRNTQDSKFWFEKALSICQDMKDFSYEKELLRDRIIELSVIDRDWEWLETLMSRYRELSTKEEVLYTCIEVAGTVNNEKASIYYEMALSYAEDLKDANAQKSIFEGLSRIYGELNDFDKQIEFLKRSLEFNKLNHITYDCLAGAYLRKNDYHAAIESACRCLDISMKKRDSIGFIRSCNKLSSAYQRLKDFTSAEEYLRKAIDYEPDNKVCYFNIAKFYTDTAQIEKALDVYAVLLKSRNLVYGNTERAELLGKMGEAYFLKEDFSRAEQCYKESVDLYLKDQPDEKYAKPSHIRGSKCNISEAYENLAQFYANIGQYIKAKESLDQSYAYCDDSRQRSSSGRSLLRGTILRALENINRR